MTRYNFRDVKHRFSHIDGELRAVEARLCGAEDAAFVRITVRLYPWWEHPQYLAARSADEAWGFDYGAEAARDLVIEAINPYRCDARASEEAIDLSFAESAPELWPYESSGVIFCNSEVDEAALFRTILDRLHPSVDQLVLARYLGGRVKARAPFSLGGLPYTLFHAAKESLDELGVRTFIPHAPAETSTPILLSIDDSVIVVAEDFFVEVPEFDHRPEWFSPPAKSSGVEHAITLGKRAEKDGDWSAAVAAYEQALAIEATKHELWSMHGLALERLGKTEAALSSFLKSTSIKPNYADHYNAGNMLLILGRNDEALQQYEASIAQWDGYAQAWVNRGIVLTKLGNLEDARESFKRGIALREDLIPAWRSLAILERKAGNREAYLAAYKRVTELAPDDPEAWFELGQAIALMPEEDIVEWEAGGREERVAAMMYKVLALDPDHVGAHGQLVYRLSRRVHGILAARSTAAVAGVGVPSGYESLAAVYLDAAREGALRFPEDEWFAAQLEDASELASEW